MWHQAWRALVMFFVVANLAAMPAKAAPIVAGTTDLPGTAIQDITLLPGTPFNRGTTPILIQNVSGVGTIVLSRDAQAGTTITIGALSGGAYFGSNPVLGAYEFGNIPPLTGSDFSASITSVVQNPSDPGYPAGQPSSFQSGDFTLGGASFAFEFLSPGPLQGVELFTDPSVPFQFAATFDGLPPSPGTVLVNSGPDVLNVLFDGVPVAQSSNRRIVLGVVTPEPTAMGLLGVGLVCLSWFRLRPSSRKTGN